MLAIRNLTLQIKLALIMTLTLVAAFVLIWIVVFPYESRTLERSMSDNLVTLATVIGTNSIAAIQFEAPGEAQDLLASLAAERHVVRASIFGPDGTLFATFRREGRQVPAASPALPGKEGARFEGGFLVVAQRIRQDEEEVGSIVLEADTTALHERIVVLMKVMGAALAAALVLALAVSWLLTRNLVRSLKTSIGLARKVATGDLTVRVEARGTDEVGQLLASIRTMTESLSSLIGRVKGSCEQMTTSTTRISGFTKNLEASATEQAASTHEVVSTATEISSTSQELVQTMGEVAEMAERTASSADTGQQGLSSMESVMSELEQATDLISSKLTAINEKAAEINTVVVTMTKVADQTNLLSLNAAIEAEKAGQYGLGFSVVAREVRWLADQTAVATLDIEKVVEDMRTAVTAGVMGMEKFSQEVKRVVGEIRQVAALFTQIIQQVHDLAPRFEVVSEGMQAQAQGAQQIRDAMAQLGSVATHTAESVRETNRALEELTRTSGELQTEITHFRTV